MHTSTTPSYLDRQYAIDHSAEIDKHSFLVSYSILFAMAELCVLLRLAIRYFGNRTFLLDDALVLLAAFMLAASYASCRRNLDALYLLEAANEGVAWAYSQEIPKLFEISKWSTITSALNWTSVYLVKMIFLYFFHTLIQGLPRRISIFYWTTVALTFAFWVYSVLASIIICPHFGADSSECSSDPNQHARSLMISVLSAITDIISDILIVTLPPVVLNLSMMPLSRKISLAAMLCLSVIMIVIAFIRLIGTGVNTKPHEKGSSPIWATYWSGVEGCVALMTTTVIVMRSVFITRRSSHQSDMNSKWSRVRRRLLSALRLRGTSSSSRRIAPRESDEESAYDPKSPHIST
ncbi:hypothetical protein F5Y08DRAFT_354271 [Xylaria arbuscula]|nr:hypothetical protein F5Y08DRAFT_354271 [Xylaria arbuscula]